MNDLGRKQKCTLYIFICAMIALAYCIYVPFHYSTDGWITFQGFDQIDGIEENKLSAVWSVSAETSVSNGRYVRGLILCIVGLFGKMKWLMSPLVSAAGIAVLAISGCVAWNTISEHMKTDRIPILPFLCLLVAFCQPFFTDWFQFSECQLFYPFGVLAAVLSAKTAFSAKEMSPARKWCRSCVWLMIAAGMYQITMQWFVLMAMSVVVIDTINNTESSAIRIAKRAISQILFVLTVYVVVAAVQLLFTYVIFDSPRTGAGQLSIGVRIDDFLRAQKNLWAMTPYTGNRASVLFPVLCISALLASVISLGKSPASSGVKCIKITAMLLCSFGFYASIFIPMFLTESWYAQRSVVGFWGIPLLLSLATGLDNPSRGGEKIIRLISVMTAGCLIAANLYSCFQFGSDLYRVNAMDTMRAQLIGEQIKNYEEETGTCVQYLAFHYDKYPMYAYPGTVNSFENNQTAWTAVWNPLAIMNIVGAKDYEEREYSDEMYLEKYADQNWNMYSPEQVFFEGNTAYIVIY